MKTHCPRGHENSYKVYIITNSTNGKNYVGLTGQKYLSNRWRGHLKCSRDGVDTYFYRALRKYGPSVFTKDIVAENISRSEAQRLEKFWIGLIHSNEKEFGYNTTFGGFAPKHTQTTREKIGYIQIGRVKSASAIANHAAAMMSSEYRQRRSEISKRCCNSPEYLAKISGDNHWTRRLGHSDETRRKMSESMKKSWASGHGLRGRRHSEATKRKISETKLGRKHNV